MAGDAIDDMNVNKQRLAMSLMTSTPAEAGTIENSAGKNTHTGVWYVCVLEVLPHWLADKDRWGVEPVHALIVNRFRELGVSDNVQTRRASGMASG